MRARVRVALTAACVIAGAVPATAGAVVPGRSQPVFRVVMVQTFIRMDDGVELAATLGLPSRDGKTVAPGRFPAILTMTPYGKDLSAPSTYFVSRGYADAVVDIRGAGASGGNLSANYFSPREQRDGYDLVEWLGRQPWSSGRVGMMGGSYLGITQYLTAEQDPPHLKAIVPQVALSDLYREATYHGGILSAFFGAQYLAVQGGPGLLSGFQETDNVGHVFTAKLGQLESKPIAFDYIANTTDDAFYRARSPIVRVNRIHVPVLILDGWFDGFIRGASEMDMALKVSHRLWVDPYPHKGARGFPYNPLGYPAQQSTRAATLVWFDRYLKGVRQPLGAPVKLYEMGSRRYLLARRWPVEHTRWTRLYLNPGKRLGSTPRAGHATYFNDPSDGFTNTLSRDGDIAASPYLPLDQSLEAGRGLTFDTAPLAKPLDLVGPLALHLEASATAKTTDWIVKVSDVDAGGHAALLTEGYLRSGFRALDPVRSKPWRPYHPHQAEAPIRPGATIPYEVEIWPTSNRFLPGHRLRVQLTSDDTPNHLAGAIHFDLTQPATAVLRPNPPTLNTVRLGASYLLAPELGVCSTPAALRVCGDLPRP